MGTLSLTVLAYLGLHDQGASVSPSDVALIDYANFVTILLSTVTVVFSVAAIALGVIGAIGFKNLKSEAAQFASAEALKSIKESFDDGGSALEYIDSEFRREDGHIRRWMEHKVRQEVTLLMPLVTAEVVNGKGIDLAPGAPTDEGEIE